MVSEWLGIFQAEIGEPAPLNRAAEQRIDAGELYLFLHVQGENGRAVEAVYELIKEGGAWRINGVVTRPDSSEKA